MRESRSLVENPRIPDAVRKAWSPGCSTVAARAPGPLHSVARMNRDGRRREVEATVADHHVKGSSGSGA